MNKVVMEKRLQYLRYMVRGLLSVSGMDNFVLFIRIS